MNRIALVVAACVLNVCPMDAQPSALARSYVDSLCAPRMNGRGCAMNGALKAATFIASNFMQLGLQPCKSSFLQVFRQDASVFQSAFNIRIDKKTLQPGFDFGCHPYEGHLSGHFKLFRLDGIESKDTWMQEMLKVSGKLRKKVLVIRRSQMQALQVLENKGLHPAAVVIAQNDKITHGIEGKPSRYPVLPMLSGALPAEATSIAIDIEGTRIKNCPFHNVIGCVKGTEIPDSFVVFTAHYDHLGQLGTGHYFPGANDNASGVAMLLSLAGYYAEHPMRYSAAFIAFDGEERGLLGSHYYIQDPLFPIKQIRFLINMDILGTGDDGIGLVNALVFTDDFDLLNNINKRVGCVEKIKKRGKAAISDHYWFTEAGIHSFYIYTMGGIDAYHDFNDRPETLPLTKFNDVFDLLVAFSNRISHTFARP